MRHIRAALLLVLPLSFGISAASYTAVWAQEDAAVHENTAVYEAGSYIVGDDLPPGEYAVFTEEEGKDAVYGSCSLTLYKDSTDEYKIGTFRFQHHGLITLYNGQHLILKKGYAVAADQAGIQPGPSGVYKIGRDMEPGTYRLSPLTSEGAYYAIYNDVRYYYDYIDAYGTFFEPVTVTLEEGQYIELTDVAYVEKVELQ